MKTQASYAWLDVGSFLQAKYVEHIARWRTPLPIAALRNRELRGLAPITREYDELVMVTRKWKPIQAAVLNKAFRLAKKRVQARGIDIPDETTFHDLRHFADAVWVASGLEPSKVQARMRHARLAETLNTYGYLVWEVDWENAPASFEELYGIPAPPGLRRRRLCPGRSANAGGQPRQASAAPVGSRCCVLRCLATQEPVVRRYRIRKYADVCRQKRTGRTLRKSYGE
ncbi:hypothetical protein GCM10018785_11680 [Streptomyces longispororuber]|uniref:Tyr recombinase domain-containing protein n=1 Tax=Streptomyces longispororuber TaxID=68230 RepID=A0A918ZB96_9ACTN|nr:tyrosine-type recombinase/integrase [Streptomyces longispororuber]GHE43763.1 hypothetical protein GCM10018785_11680 [Streptomyces longispororuber]